MSKLNRNIGTPLLSWCILNFIDESLDICQNSTAELLINCNITALEPDVDKTRWFIPTNRKRPKIESKKAISEITNHICCGGEIRNKSHPSKIRVYEVVILHLQTGPWTRRIAFRVCSLEDLDQDGKDSLRKNTAPPLFQASVSLRFQLQKFLPNHSVVARYFRMLTYSILN